MLSGQPEKNGKLDMAHACLKSFTSSGIFILATLPVAPMRIFNSCIWAAERVAWPGPSAADKPKYLDLPALRWLYFYVLVCCNVDLLVSNIIIHGQWFNPGHPDAAGTRMYVSASPKRSIFCICEGSHVYVGKTLAVNVFLYGSIDIQRIMCE